MNKNDAISILDAAGWKPGENGIREKETKTGPLKLEFDLAVPKIPFLVSTAEHLRDAWSAIGAKVNLAILDPEEITSRTIKNREYQAVLFGNFLNPADDLYPFWHSNERFYPGLNLALYSNKKADQLIESIRREPNEAKRAEAGQNLASTIKADAPAVFLYSPNYTYIVSRDVRGIIAGPIAEPTDRYSTIAKWHVRTTRALR